MEILKILGVHKRLCKILRKGSQRFKSSLTERSFDSGQNYIDRVRIKQNSTNPDTAHRGSGWRQRSISNLDLTKSSSNCQFRYPRSQQESQDLNNNSQLQDYYDRIEPAKDYEDHYYESYEKNQREEPIYQQYESGTDFCSLRRTRSLAVIREETYNDLQINAINTRRSQLIPRARIVHKNFFHDRFAKKHRREEDSTGSGVDTQTSETRESDDYYANLKRLDSVKIFPSSWQNPDKSDLESLNSDYFKNSHHQKNRQHHPYHHYKDKYKQQQLRQQLKYNKTRKQNSQFQVLEIEVHHDNSQSSAFPETTTSNSDNSDSCSNQDQEEISKPNREHIESPLEEISLLIEPEIDAEVEEQIDNIEEIFPSGTLSLKKDKESKGYIAYNTVYLSSEDSSDDTVVNDLNKKSTSLSIDSQESDFVEGKCANTSSNQLTKSRDTEKLYSKVSKPTTKLGSKPRILALEKKIKKPSLIADYFSSGRRGTLERLTCISTSQILKNQSFRPNLIDNQYFSLPDINIGHSLNVSERIDAKLRSTYDHRQDKIEIEDVDKPPYSELNPAKPSDIDDSITRFGRAHKRVRQQEFTDTDSLNEVDVSPSPTYDDSILTDQEIEQPKEAPSIEVDGDYIATSTEDSDRESSLGKCNETEIVFAQSETSNYLRTDNEQINSPDSENTYENRVFLTPEQFKIVVTDSLNNIIEEDSIESIPRALSDLSDQEAYSNESQLSESSGKSMQLAEAEEKPHLYFEKKVHQPDIRKAQKVEIKTDNQENHVFQAKPAHIISDEILSERQLKMSRPQILHVVDSKHRCSDNSKAIGSNIIEKTEKEFLEKVDSARCYWSKLIQDEKEAEAQLQPKHDQTETATETERNFVTSLEDDVVDSAKPESVGQLKHISDCLQSFSPTVEIVEINGQKQATIVKAHNLEGCDFDHVRYRVMKSDLFQKNILARAKKEAQFDGLMQYLQDYSFQELLTNNNVVIIEPVRTKIEKPCDSKAKLDTVNCKITVGSGAPAIDHKYGNSKRHFFYHPVRVNRELIEEELPNPDTVRNVRKFFEENVLNKQSSSTSSEAIKLQREQDAIEGSSEGATGFKRRTLRYLTIDTSFGNGLRKWDSASLSSGVSSGDLSSPCECNEGDHQDDEDRHRRRRQHIKASARPVLLHQEDNYSSAENICEDGMCQSYYVSKDILEKIRECGSTVTYYGGRVVDNKSPELSPMTKAIIQEIRGQDVKCLACQPNNCPHDDELQEKFGSNQHLGLKFKLVKSNSCSSRLELVGTERSICQDRDKSPAIKENSPLSPTPSQEPEETVRELVNRLEGGKTNNNCSIPRIIESKCIEKSLSSKSSSSIDDIPLTINNHLVASTGDRMGPVDIIKHVTVNNHISFFSPLSPALSTTSSHSSSSTTISGSKNPTSEKSSAKNQKGSSEKSNPNGINKICRNKNVDLAFGLVKNYDPSNKSQNNNDSRRASSTSSVDIDNLINPNKKVTTATETIPNKFTIPSPQLAPAITELPALKSTLLVTNVGLNGDVFSGKELGKSLSNGNHATQNEVHTQRDSRKSTTICQAINSLATSQPKIASTNSSNSIAVRNVQIDTTKNEDNNNHPTTNGHRNSNQNGNSPTPAPKGDGSTFYEKFFVANDRKLIEKRKYDEIEFEEFEVYNPETARLLNEPKNPTEDVHNEQGYDQEHNVLDNESTITSNGAGNDAGDKNVQGFASLDVKL